MDTGAIKQLILQIAIAFGGWVTISSALAVWFSQIITKRLFNEWDKKNQIQIEYIRHAQQESQLILKELISTSLANQSQIQTRRLEAVDKLWNVIIKLRQNSSPITLYFDVALPSEFSQLRTNPKTAEFFKDITNSRFLEWAEIARGLENYRPYLSERLWSVFYLFRSILGRLAILIIRIKQGEEVGNWKQDSVIHESLKALLDKNEFEIVTGAGIQSATIAVNFIESRILREITNVLSGRESSLEGLQNSVEIQKLIAKAFKDSPEMREFPEGIKSEQR